MQQVIPASKTLSIPRAGRRLVLRLFAVLTLLPVSAFPQAEQTDDREIVAYEASFFDRYQPNTALDMVQRLPGFIIDDGGDKRGFGAATGNVLINDRYPSTKQDKPTDILERISSSQVERIDLIRGQVRSIDLRGQGIVASVILRGDLPATGRWEFAVRKNLNQSPVTLRSAVSVSDNWRSIDYLAGLTYRRFNSSEKGPEVITDPAGQLLEARDRDADLSGDEGEINVGMFTWLGDTAIALNTRIGFEDRVEPLAATTSSLAPAPQTQDFFIDDDERFEYEIGADAEHRVSDHFLTKGILVHTQRDADNITSQRKLDETDAQILFRVATSNVVSTETILRSESTWTSSDRRTMNLNIEGARNTIEGSLLQTVDTGSGPVIVPVPGSNTRVEEDRIDALLYVTEYRGQFEIGYGLGIESSTLRQSGDVDLKRQFDFLKPQFLVVWSPAQSRQTRFRIAREVSQLDFNDFVSSTIFQDDDLALGNPDLKPESTWLAELSEEIRFGELGVIKGTLFYNDISDVEDLLPLSAEFEAPGNIGDGRRYGIQFEATLPLQSLGLSGARIDVEGRWQRSSVVDPVTGEDRQLSGEAQESKPLPFDVENRYVFSLSFRQDIQKHRVSWGGDVRLRDDRLSYRVNELIRFSEEEEINVFVEKTTLSGLRIRLEGNNLLDINQIRDRDIFVGERSLTPLDVIEERNIQDGRRIILSLSGSF